MLIAAMANERDAASETLWSAAESLLASPRDAAARILGPDKAITLDFSITASSTWGPDVALALLTRRERDAPVARRLCRVHWDKLRDFERLRSMTVEQMGDRTLSPSVDVRVIKAPFAESWLAEARELRVPLLYPEPLVGRDGEDVTVQFGETPYQPLFRWWNDGPAEWSPLVEWAKRIRERTEALFADKAVRLLGSST
jgi:hypothetical protein